MSRFDRQATEGGDLPALLGSATEEFRRSLEGHVQQVVEVAKDHAAEIEREAHRKAKNREQQLDVRSQELVQGVITRASSVLDSIELVQTAISGMLAELRSEVKALESGGASGSAPDPAARPQALLGLDQRLAKEAPAQPTQSRVAPPEATVPTPSPAQPAPSTAPAPTQAVPAAKPQQAPAPRPSAQAPQVAKPLATVEAPAPAAEPARQETSPLEQPAQEQKPASPAMSAPTQPKTQTDRTADTSAEFDQMIHGEIRRMFQSGKSREDVESFLCRFELGDSYLGLLDELYSQRDASGRRKIFGRRRER